MSFIIIDVPKGRRIDVMGSFGTLSSARDYKDNVSNPVIVNAGIEEAIYSKEDFIEILKDFCGFTEEDASQFIGDYTKTRFKEKYEKNIQ